MDMAAMRTMDKRRWVGVVGLSLAVSLAARAQQAPAAGGAGAEKPMSRAEAIQTTLAGTFNSRYGEKELKGGAFSGTLQATAWQP
jgi:hypothetical protein